MRCFQFIKDPLDYAAHLHHSNMEAYERPSAGDLAQAAGLETVVMCIAMRHLLTDNGHCYRSSAFRAACAQLGIAQRFTRPYTPRANGNAERFIQTAVREWAYARAYETLPATR